MQGGCRGEGIGAVEVVAGEHHHGAYGAGAQCEAMGPMVDKLAEEYEGRVEIGKYNTDDGNDFCMANRVMSIRPWDAPWQWC